MPEVVEDPSELLIAAADTVDQIDSQLRGTVGELLEPCQALLAEIESRLVNQLRGELAPAGTLLTDLEGRIRAAVTGVLGVVTDYCDCFARARGLPPEAPCPPVPPIPLFPVPTPVPPGTIILPIPVPQPPGTVAPPVPQPPSSVAPVFPVVFAITGGGNVSLRLVQLESGQYQVFIPPDLVDPVTGLQLAIVCPPPSPAPALPPSSVLSTGGAVAPGQEPAPAEVCPPGQQPAPAPDDLVTVDTTCGADLVALGGPVAEGLMSVDPWLETVAGQAWQDRVAGWMPPAYQVIRNRLTADDTFLALLSDLYGV